MTQTDDNIKFCPFCGKKPRFSKCEGEYGYTPNEYSIRCKCGAEMNLTDDYTKPSEDCKTELINRWNSRKVRVRK